MGKRQLVILLILLYIFGGTAIMAEARTYSKEQPLVYEDPLNIWPFSFVNEDGEADGFNIDLLKLLMKELKIPYVIKLREHQEVLEDIKQSQSDLTLGPTTVFYRQHSLYGRQSIILLTQSVATPKKQPVTISTFRDLGRKGQRVVVSDSSICHHLMKDYGWEANITSSSDISKSIRQLNKSGQGMIVWNTLSLQWLIHHYGLENLKLTPVNMPHSEYKYMSNDKQLLNLIDSTYAQLAEAGKLLPLEKKWFYNNNNSLNTPVWMWCLMGLVVLLTGCTLLYIRHITKQYRHIRMTNNKLRNQLIKISQDSALRIWIYDIRKRTFTWMDNKGKATISCKAEEFFKRYNKEDSKRLQEALDRLASQQKDAKGHEETESMLELKAKDKEYDDGELHDFVVVFSVMKRDRSGRPSIIMGTKKDITMELRLKEKNSMRSLRYWSVFYNDDSGIIQFDQDGFIQNANLMACELFQCNIDNLVEKHIHINQFLNTTFTDLNHVNGFRGAQTVNQKIIDYQIKTIYNDQNKLLGLFVFCQ